MPNKIQTILNFIFFPIRCVFPNNEYISFLPVSPLSEDRFMAVAEKLLPGKYVLDIGCGDNRLVKRYRQVGGRGVGIDLAPNDTADMEIKRSDRLSFPDNEFDYIVIIASINHIPTREATLAEAYRCLKKDGQIFITNLSPIVGWVGHKIWGVLKTDLDLGHRGGMIPGEKYGLPNSQIVNMLSGAGFVDIKVKKFSLGFNNLIVAIKK